MATFPWIARHEWHDVGLKNFKNLTRWYNEISKRALVIKGFDIFKREKNTKTLIFYKKIFSSFSCLSCASILNVAIGLAINLFRPIGSPVSSQNP